MMGSKNYLILSLWIVVLHLGVVATQTVSEPVTTCPEADGEAMSMLDECNKNMNTFLHHYKKFSRNRRGERDMCQLYLKYKTCMEPILINCTHLRESHEAEWGKIDSLMTCACVNKSEGCRETLKCMRHQYMQPLVVRCDVMYKFQRRQKVYDKCSLVRESLLCQGGMVRTACGDTAGSVSFQLAKISSALSSHRRGCNVSSAEPYTGFTYSRNCSANFTSHMDTCYFDHIYNKQILFNKDNDLIADGRESQIKRACRNYNRYLNCVKPIVSWCQEGITLLYEMDGRLRTYLLKMKYICNKEHRSYHKKIRCIKGSITNGTLDVCRPVWDSVQPHLGAVTAYQFYCSEAENGSLVYQLHRGLGELRQCYKAAFSSYCGRHTGDLMDGLMASVFHDPFYLRFEHKPRCRVHLNTTTTVPTTTVTEMTTMETAETVSQSKARATTVPPGYAYKATSGGENTHFCLTLLLFATVLVFPIR